MYQCFFRSTFRLSFHLWCPSLLSALTKFGLESDSGPRSLQMFMLIFCSIFTLIRVKKKCKVNLTYQFAPIFIII